jgi:hypothetical protein
MMPARAPAATVLPLHTVLGEYNPYLAIGRGAMTNSSRPERAFRLNTRPLMVGGALMGLAGVLGLAGIVVSGTALAAAVREWASRQEVPPTELARHHWARAKAATAAGATHWRNGTQEHATRS